MAAVIWLISSVLLSWYLEKFAHYDATYGSLGAGIAMMMWMWVSAIAILFGAELNAEIEHQTARDSTVGREKPLGGRRAAMADTVGPSTPGTENRGTPRSQAAAVFASLLARFTERGDASPASKRRHSDRKRG